MSSIIPPLVSNSPPPIDCSPVKSSDDDEPIDFNTSIDIPSPLRSLSLPSTPDTSSIKSSTESNQVSTSVIPIVEFEVDFDNCPFTVNSIDCNTELLPPKYEDDNDDSFDDFDDFQTAKVIEQSQPVEQSNDVLLSTNQSCEKTYEQLEELIKLAFGEPDNDEVTMALNSNGEGLKKINPINVDNDAIFAQFTDIEESAAMDFRWKNSQSERLFLESLNVKKEAKIYDFNLSSVPSKTSSGALNHQPLEPKKVHLTKPTQPQTNQEKSNEKSKDALNLSSTLTEEITSPLQHISKISSNIDCDKNCDNITTEISDSFNLMQIISPTKSKNLEINRIEWPNPGSVDNLAISEFINSYRKVNTNAADEVAEEDWTDFMSNKGGEGQTDGNSTLVTETSNDTDVEEWGDFISIKSESQFENTMFKQNIRAEPQQNLYRSKTDSAYFFSR